MITMTVAGLESLALPTHSQSKFTFQSPCWHQMTIFLILLDFSLTVKAAPHECVIRTGQP